MLLEMGEKNPIAGMLKMFRGVCVYVSEGVGPFLYGIIETLLARLIGGW